jgi:hypothetical protein
MLLDKFYILNFNRLYLLFFYNALLRPTAHTGYMILQYSVTVYVNCHIYLMTALRGRNIEFT